MRKIYFQKLLTRFLFLVLLLCSITAFSQNGVITGTVKNDSGETIPGVIVTQKNTKNQTITNLNGKFKITLKEGDKILVFSSLGLKTVEMPGVSSTLNVTLEDDLRKLDEVIVVGYGTQSKGDNLGAVSSINAKGIQQIAPINAFDAIQGRLAGVQILSNGGPGAGSEIKIRGTSTILGGADPLYVVDGQQMDDIDNLNPNDIESITVLKDGASAAIYGSKSANGVVMITTKKGANEKPKIDVSYTGTYSYVYNKIPVANSRQRYDFEKLRNGVSIVPDDKDSLSLIKSVSTDLQDEILRPAYRNQLSLSFRGGNKTSDYFFSTSYLSDKGIVIGSDYNRFNTNLNLNFKINDFISAGTRILNSYEDGNGLSEYSVFSQLSFRQPNLLVRDYDGSLFPLYGGRQNPLGYALEQTNRSRSLRGNFFNYAEVEIIPSLTFKATLGINYNYRKQNNFTPSTLKSSPADGFERQSIGYDVQQEDYLNYKKAFGKHHLSGLLGVSFQRWRSEGSELRAIAFANDLIPYFNNVKEFDTGRSTSGASGHALASQFGRISYDFDKKYLLSATLRRDGSSRFGADKRYGIFPAVSVGWIVTKEKFMANISKNALTTLKLRAGYSINGNERIDDYGSLYLYSPGQFYDGTNGIAATQFASDFLQWESTNNLNVGADLEFFRGKINASVDFYNKTTKDLLYNVPVPLEFGVSNNYLANVGSIENQGIEFDISAFPIRKKGFSWNTSFNIAFNRNKVLSLQNPLGFEKDVFKIEPGQPLGNMYGYKNLGVYAYDESNAYAENGNRLTPVFNGGVFSSYTLNGQPYTGTVKKMDVQGKIPGGGDIIWEDQNGDFNIDSQHDRTIIGNGLAKSTGGFFNEFKYKNYSLSFLFDFNLGNDIYKYYEDYRNTGSNSVFTPSPYFIDGAWRNPGDVTEYPSLQSNRSQNRIGNDSHFVSKGSYIKWRNVRVNYILPKELYKNLTWVNNVSLNISANNLITFTNYDGYNPEVGGRGNNLEPGYDKLRYPNKTTFILGLRVQL
jgi:TonB-linked SusC/RagA family outer membrane protein